MTNVAEKFINELKAGKISEAIDTIKAGLQESELKLVEQKRQQVLESYGFIVSEKKKMSEEEYEDSEEMDDESDDDSIDDELDDELED